MVRTLLALCLVLAGCAGSPAADRETLRAAQEEAARAEEELTDLNARAEEQADRIRELEGQLAMFRSEARDLRARMTDTVRIGDEEEPSRAPAAAQDEPEDEANDRRRIEVAAEEDEVGVAPPRPGEAPPIVLRLYGTPSERSAGPDPGGELPPLVVPPRPSYVPGRLPVTGPADPRSPPGVPLPSVSPPPAPNVAPRPAPPDAAVAAYRLALGLVRDRRFPEALGALDGFLHDHPRHQYTDNALYWRGEVRYALRQYREALTDFEVVVERYPRGSKVADALLKIGMCHMRMGNLARARTFFERVREQFPDSIAAQLASREEAAP